MSKWHETATNCCDLPAPPPLAQFNIVAADRLRDRRRADLCDRAVDDRREFVDHKPLASLCEAAGQRDAELLPIRQAAVGTQPGWRRAEPDGRQGAGDLAHAQLGRERIDDRPVFRPIEAGDQVIAEQLAGDGRFAAAGRSDDEADLPRPPFERQIDRPGLLRAFRRRNVEHAFELLHPRRADDGNRARDLGVHKVLSGKTIVPGDFQAISGRASISSVSNRCSRSS